MERVIIDTDPAIGVPFRDIDDALAIALALLSEELTVEGVTVVHGNVDQKRAYQSARLMMKAAGREDVPLLAGARTSRDTARLKETDASRFIAEKLNAAPGEISLITLGPLSNVATAERISPGTLQNARRVTVMGGAIDGFGVAPPMLPVEFNFWKDPPAAALLLEKARNLTLIPLDLTRKVIFGASQMRRLSDSDSELAHFLHSHTRSWHALMSVLTLRGGFMPHDPIALAYMLRPELFSVAIERLKVVQKHGFSYGVLKRDKIGFSACVAYDVREKQFLDFLIERLTRRR